jgi:mRNA-degrading endonuclease RelE of RelBE toxin-antitoxin system
MRYEIIFAPEAIEDLKRLSARNRTIIRDEVEKFLRFEPDKISQSRIKRLQGISRPQYRLRVGDIRVFYDLEAETVEILAIVEKAHAGVWLAEKGE